jgi:hypothetical protein
VPAQSETLVHSTVLQGKDFALWPEKEVWTSVFEMAIVLKSPSETGNLCKIKFDEAKHLWSHMGSSSS